MNQVRRTFEPLKLDMWTRSGQSRGGLEGHLAPGFVHLKGSILHLQVNIITLFF